MEICSLKNNEIEEKSIPTRSNRSGKNKGKYPLDKKILDKINLKHKLCKKLIAKRGSTDRKEYENLRHQYNKMRNQVKSLTNKLKKAFERDLAKKS